MIKIIGERGSGKTTKILEAASKNGCVVVEPNSKMAEYVSRMARDKGYDLRIISAYDFLLYKNTDRSTQYVVDELDLFLSAIGIKGYSNGPM